jgi:hypothetical protein
MQSTTTNWTINIDQHHCRVFIFERLNLALSLSLSLCPNHCEHRQRACTGRHHHEKCEPAHESPRWRSPIGTMCPHHLSLSRHSPCLCLCLSLSLSLCLCLCLSPSLCLWLSPSLSVPLLGCGWMVLCGGVCRPTRQTHCNQSKKSRSQQVRLVVRSPNIEIREKGQSWPKGVACVHKYVFFVCVFVLFVYIDNIRIRRKFNNRVDDHPLFPFVKPVD